jgi:hypothetical protein
VEISLQISWFLENSLPAFVGQPFVQSQNLSAKFKDCSLEDFTISAQLLVCPNFRADVPIS